MEARRAWRKTLEVEDRDSRNAGVKNEPRIREVPLPGFVVQTLTDLWRLKEDRTGSDLVIDVHELVGVFRSVRADARGMENGLSDPSQGYSEHSADLHVEAVFAAWLPLRRVREYTPSNCAAYCKSFILWSGYTRIRNWAGLWYQPLAENTHFLEANGESYRLREAQKRLKRTASQRSKKD